MSTLLNPMVFTLMCAGLNGLAGISFMFQKQYGLGGMHLAYCIAGISFSFTLIK